MPKHERTLPNGTHLIVALEVISESGDHWVSFRVSVQSHEVEGSFAIVEDPDDGETPVEATAAWLRAVELAEAAARSLDAMVALPS